MPLKFTKTEISYIYLEFNCTVLLAPSCTRAVFVHFGFHFLEKRKKRLEEEIEFGTRNLECVSLGVCKSFCFRTSRTEYNCI
jgi:hypothetical protein